MGVDARIRFETIAPLGDDQLKNWRYRLHDCFGNALFLMRKGHKKIGEITRHVIMPDEQGGYEVSLMGLYYGIDSYERGHLPDLIGIMEWLIRQPETKAVYYGSDSGGEFEEFDEDLRGALWGHFARVGHLPYLGVGERPMFRDGPIPPPCPDCSGDTWESGCAGGKDMYSCPGCGWSDWLVRELAP